MKVLLLGAGGNAGINFTKSLKEYSLNEYTVYGIDINPYYLATSNVDYKLKLAFSTQEEKVDNLLKLVKEHGIDVIHAQPDPEVEFLLKNIDHFEGKVFKHNIDTWNDFRNKLDCQEKWCKGVQAFTTASYKTTYQIPYLFGEMLEKGKGKVWIRAIKGSGSKAALPVNTMEQAESWVNYWRETKGISENDFMLSQYLPGKEYAVQTFWYNGELMHAQARERVAYFFGALMPSGQTSTPSVAKTVSEPDVYWAAYAAIRTIDKTPHGIYCVDLKRDHEDNPVPMEVNYGRFFTTVDFFAKLGMNTPDTYMQTMQGVYPNKMIDELQTDYYWIRGLDKEPKLILPCEL